MDCSHFCPQVGVPNITVSSECQANFTSGCGEDVFNQIGNITAQVLPSQVVKTYLSVVFKAQGQLLNVSTLNPQKLATYGNSVLNTTEKLVSTLVKPTDTTDFVNMSLDGLDIQAFTVGPKANLTEIPQLSVKNTQMDIDLIQISDNNNGSAAVAFMSYSNMENMLKPSFFNPTNNSVKTMMSTVVSATLPKTPNTQLSTPVNFTLQHITDIAPDSTLSCVYWNNTEWIVDGCELLQSSTSYSVCSCVHLSTFALIMEINPPPGDNSDPLMELLNTVAVAVGLFFLSLTLLTLALCRQNLRRNLTPLTNLCLSLFLAHLLFLLTQKFLQYIRANQTWCAVMAGVLHFLFLSAFVWMFIEAVMLFISVKNIMKIRSKQEEVLGWRCLTVIGYVIPLVVVGVSVGLYPDGYGSDQCWIKTDRDFVWSFLGPVCLILTLNFIIFITVIIILRTALSKLSSERSQIKQMRVLVFKTLIQIVILGGPWILGFFVDGSNVLAIVFLFLNSQQGTFIFLVHCVLNHEVRQQYRKWLKTFCRYFRLQYKTGK
ncbi:adhesion G protein-coupled receptor E3-like [Hoplias malabaricus]|uniref:adhesion G protein-coupled receptor E3-like n=1 Tax=Hoplias malabaricus TaxID=27720 RepID=UPI0034633F15